MNAKQLDVWSIRDATERSQGYWKHAGRAFVNRDGSINVLLDVLPIEGKLQIRKRKENEVGEPRPNGQQASGQGGSVMSDPLQSSQCNSEPDTTSGAF